MLYPLGVCRNQLRAIIALAAVLLMLPSIVHAQETRELYRIRLINRENGSIEVSDDGGRSYVRVGKVLRAAVSTTQGFSASVFSEPGRVVATAVHGIRVKTGGSRDCLKEYSQTISIIPREFAHTPTGFGGYVAGPSGIYTDILTGQGIFRNLCPFVGNLVYRQVGSELRALPDGYFPQDGDTLVIIVTVPARYPKEVLIENKTGGTVRLVFGDGDETVARVERPVRGIGRFDATGYTGVGRINTNHTGVLTISTAAIADGAKDGSSHETRGGFMIQPSRHAKTNKETNQILVVAPIAEGGAWLEGMPPIFSGYIGLSYDPSDERNSFSVAVKTDKSGWIPMPQMLGVREDALMHLPNGAGAVTDIRIRFPELSIDWIHAQLGRANREYMARGKARAVANGTAVITDDALTLNVDAAKLHGVGFVNLYLDGQFKGSSNIAPYSFTLVTKQLSPGEHVAVIRAIDTSGITIKQAATSFFIQGEGDASGVR